MSTLQEKIESYISTFSDTVSLDNWITAGVKYISDLLPAKDLIKYSIKVPDSGSGVDIANKKVLYATKAGYGAIPIEAEKAARANLQGSIYEATTTYPMYYIEDGKGYIIPGGGDFHIYEYPIVSSSLTEIPFFPTTHEHTVILFATIQAAIKLLNDSIALLETETINTAEKPTEPKAPIYYYKDATGTVLTSTDIVINSSLPTYIEPVTIASFNNLESYIASEEDFEKASSEVNQQKTKLEQFQMNLYNALNKFNEKEKQYELELRKAIAQAELTQKRLEADAERLEKVDLVNNAKQLETQISEYTSLLNKYQVKVSVYQNEINKIVQEYATNIQKRNAKIQSMVGLITSLKSEYLELIKILRGTNE